MMRLWFCLLALISVGCASVEQPDADPLDAVLARAAEELATSAAEDGAEAFAIYRLAASGAAEEVGEPELATRINALVPGRRPGADDSSLASRLLRRYVVARYGSPIVRDLQTIVGFRTFAEEGQENWMAPEFLRQRDWLAGRAADLGLEFRTFDGRVDEVELAGGERVLGILTHGDVQGVEGQSWSVPPWEGQRDGDRIVGRGTEDDKGPIITTLYVFAALRDSGWPVGATLRLMIANGEESSWEEIPYYLERRAAPDVTLGVDASYPVTHAQKAWTEVGILAEVAADVETEPRWRVLGLSGGSGLSIIAEQAEALLAAPRGQAAESALAALKKLGDRWAGEHPPASFDYSLEGDRIVLRAAGRGGHSSVPESGHNAFGDLVAFLATLDLYRDGWGAVTTFCGRAIGTEVDGLTLGLAHDDPVMGPLTVNLALFDELDGKARARMSLRVPRGFDEAAITDRVSRVTTRIAADLGVPLEATVAMGSPPHFVPPDGPLVRTLISIWEEVTGEPGFPVAIGGGTQARLFPDGVDFGPALAMERYRGHGPDEYITVPELERNAELTLAALWALSEVPR